MKLTKEEQEKFDEYDNYRQQMAQAESVDRWREAQREREEEIAVLERILARLKSDLDSIF